MSDHTGIEWTDATWNPIRGCSRVSDGCRRCYAEAVAARFSGSGQAYEGLARMRTHVNGIREPQWTGEVHFIEKHLTDPLQWRNPRRVFVNSMSDLFHEKVTDEQLHRIFAVMAQSPRHTFQILTKRPDRMLAYLSERGRLEDIYAVWHWTSGTPREAQAWPLPNVWLGVSTEDQKTADKRIPLLLQTPAAVRFISAEPLLGPIDLESDDGNWVHVHPLPDFDGGGGMYAGKHVGRTRRCSVCEGQTVLDWVIVGGESGSGARPCQVDWIREIVGQCMVAGVPVFVKQVGSDPVDTYQNRESWQAGGFGTQGATWHPRLLSRKGGDMGEWPQDLRIRQFPREAAS